MSIQNLPLMRAMASKMQYLEQRQGVISQNIANADTPNYQSKDLTKVDFGAVLQGVSGGDKKVNVAPVVLAATDEGHLGSANQMDSTNARKDRLTYEVAPDKNGVILEEQLVKANEIQMDYALMTSLMTKVAGLYRTALGRQ